MEVGCLREGDHRLEEDVFHQGVTTANTMNDDRSFGEMHAVTTHMMMTNIEDDAGLRRKMGVMMQPRLKFGVVPWESRICINRMEIAQMRCRYPHQKAPTPAHLPLVACFEATADCQSITRRFWLRNAPANGRQPVESTIRR